MKSRDAFLCLAELKACNTDAIVKKIVKVIFNRSGLDSSFIVGQCYDGASVMSGDVQQKLEEYVCRNEFVPYVNCPAHQLNPCR